MTQQQITPELRQWIVEQVQAGHPVESLLKSMQAGGWTEDVAIQALETTLQEFLQRQSASVATPSGLPPAVKVPEARLEEAALYLDAGDRQVQVLTTVAHPRVIVLGGFLSDEECAALIEAAKPRLTRSLTISVKTGGEETHADRTSNGMFFQRGEDEVVRRVEERIARVLNWPIENGEGMQILQYRAGTEYKPHYDYFDPAEPGTPTILKRGGQRVATVIMYLSEPAKGGATVFPDIQLAVSPIRGNAVFFSYERAHPTTKSLHGGAPVIDGEKWIATKWLREREFT
jgi:prolyl 4-hydroxylase